MELSAQETRTESEDRATAWTPTGGIMGVLVSGMGVGYLSKRWKRSSSDGSMGSERGPLQVTGFLGIINDHTVS